MTIQTQAVSKSGISGISAAFVVAVMGIALMVVTGHVQAATLHDAAHDVRHATGFPCH
jgi:cobalt transporter subunit CbtB